MRQLGSALSPSSGDGRNRDPSLEFLRGGGGEWVGLDRKERLRVGF
jgi:hypothetical protein